MAKRKAEADAFKTMFPDLPYYDEDDKPKASAPAPEMSALQAQLATLTSELQTLRNERFTYGQTTTPDIPPQVQREIDYDKLPDPNADPAGYARALQMQMEAVANGKQRLKDWESEQNAKATAKVDNLWNGFLSNEKYAPYAAEKDRKKVEFVATQVAEKAKAAGKNLDRYMFATPTQFYDDVAKEFNEQFGAPKLGDDEDEPESVRTGGIPGGLESGGRTSGSEKDDGYDISDGIREWQTKHGFYR